VPFTRSSPDRLPPPGSVQSAPSDVRLALPEGRYSFPLQQAVVYETVTGALRQARDGLDRQLMQITTDAAQDVRDFCP
jgi:hypothetical protein